MQDPARIDGAIAVALGGADYDWNRWAGHSQTPPPHLNPTKTPKQHGMKHKKDTQNERKQADFTVSLPVEAAKVGKADGEVEDEGPSGHDRHGGTLFDGYDLDLFRP